MPNPMPYPGDKNPNPEDPAKMIPEPTSEAKVDPYGFESYQEALRGRSLNQMQSALFCSFSPSCQPFVKVFPNLDGSQDFDDATDETIEAAEAVGWYCPEFNSVTHERLSPRPTYCPFHAASARNRDRLTREVHDSAQKAARQRALDSDRDAALKLTEVHSAERDMLVKEIAEIIQDAWPAMRMSTHAAKSIVDDERFVVAFHPDHKPNIDEHIHFHYHQLAENQGLFQHLPGTWDQHRAPCQVDPVFDRKTPPEENEIAVTIDGVRRRGVIKGNTLYVKTGPEDELKSLDNLREYFAHTTSYSSAELPEVTLEDREGKELRMSLIEETESKPWDGLDTSTWPPRPLQPTETTDIRTLRGVNYIREQIEEMRAMIANLVPEVAIPPQQGPKEDD